MNAVFRLQNISITAGAAQKCMSIGLAWPDTANNENKIGGVDGRG